MSQDLQRKPAQGPVTALTVIALGVGLNMLDGFDVLAMSFAASGVKADWHLLDSQLGALLSAGLVGMGLGSLTLGPCADRWGRRIIVLYSVALAGLGMLGTALAIYATGYSIGATIGGALAAYSIPRYGWRAAFVIGGALSLLMLPLAWRKLPDSLDFLLTRKPPLELGRVDTVLRGQDSVGAQLRLLMRPSTLLVWIVFFCTMASFYFILSWTPRLLNAAGLSAGQGMTGGVLLNLGGIAGCALFAFAAAHADTHRLLAHILV
jgi:MFS transporter, AAHS family, vanillate permease